MACLPSELLTLIFRNCHTQTLKQLRLTSHEWTVEVSKCLFATVSVYLWPSSLFKLYCLSKSNLSRYVRTVVYIAEMLPRLGFRQWSESVEGTAANQSRPIRQFLMRLGYLYYEYLRGQQLRMCEQPTKCEMMGQILPRFTNLKRLETGNGHIIQSESKLTCHYNLAARLRPFSEKLADRMGCDSTYFTDLHWHMGKRDEYTTYHAPDIREVLSKSTHIRELVYILSFM